ILREAGIRMPSAVGNTISVVGGLVIGQAAVTAGIISPAVVIVVSLTAITSYVAPAYSLAITARILRFLLLLAAATFGMYGIAITLLIILLHLCGLRTFGVPYLQPFAPMVMNDLKDTLMRPALWSKHKRPKLTRNSAQENTTSPSAANSNSNTGAEKNK
ncbi:MAG: spore germination protein, partial [Paenibacillus sp.]|nr:spore germination protein [Paenibacillus sp.]